jgi:hypothetical protein
VGVAVSLCPDLTGNWLIKMGVDKVEKVGSVLPQPSEGLHSVFSVFWTLS